MAKKAVFEHLFAVDDDRRIRANVVYRKIKNDFIGSFYGYEGGGAYADGLFWIDKDGQLLLDWDENEFPEKFHKALDELTDIRNGYGGYDPETEEEGFPSKEGYQLGHTDNAQDYDEHWEYRSDGFDDNIIKLISASWGLSMRWS